MSVRGEVIDLSSLVETDTTWHVLQVRSQQEKMLAADLTAMRISYYLPLVSEVRYTRGRKGISETPLFPGYLFLRGTLDEAYEADRTKRVARILRVVDQQQIDWELRNLERALSQQGTLDPYPHLAAGRRVEVRSGPFRGLQGVVEDRLGPGRLILQVTVLGTATQLEIDGALLEPVD